LTKKKPSLLYVLPNIFTATGLFLGVLSMIYATNTHITTACYLIMFAMVFDGLDGRIARITGTTSQFGVEFDSLADIVSFGVAPAMVLYLYSGYTFSKIGALISCLFVIFGAMRLARFNTSVGKQEPSVFIGLPIPAAALFVIAWILLYEHFDLKSYSKILLGMSLCIAVLMVSNIRFPSFKNFYLSEKNKKKFLILLVFFLSFVYALPAQGIALIITGYVLFSLIRAGYYVVIFRGRFSKNTKNS
jgi:CDP-diacylglycerol---serine O-phosphatidyltransferase